MTFNILSILARPCPPLLKEFTGGALRYFNADTPSPGLSIRAHGLWIFPHSRQWTQVAVIEATRPQTTPDFSLFFHCCFAIPVPPLTCAFLHSSLLNSVVNSLSSSSERSQLQSRFTIYSLSMPSSLCMGSSIPDSLIMLKIRWSSLSLMLFDSPYPSPPTEVDSMSAQTSPSSNSPFSRFLLTASFPYP